MEASKEASKVGPWEGILREVATASKSPDSVLLMLGRSGIGKRTLSNELLRHACPAAAEHENETVGRGALDFSYFGVRDPSLNDKASEHDFQCQAACSVLMLEDPRYEKLLRSRLATAKLRYCAAMICLDLKEPWTLMEDLRTWLEIARSISSELLVELGMEEQDELRQKVVKVMEDYREPTGKEGDSENAADGVSGNAASISCNLALPLVVCVLRADGASALEAQKTIGWAETIEVHLRNECLSYGAAIVYTMVQPKNSSNVAILYEYLMHRMYAYPFERKAQVPSRDALFIPSGWDSRQKVDQAASNLAGGGLEQSFESVVTPPQQQNSAPPKEEETEDMNVFLKKAASQLQKLGGNTVASSQRSRAPPTLSGAGANGDAVPGLSSSKDASKPRAAPMDLAGPGARRASQMTPDSAAAPGVPGAPGTDNQQLANFFQNLLTRGQSGPLGGPSPTGTGAAPKAGTPGGPRFSAANAVRQSFAKTGPLAGLAGVTAKAPAVSEAKPPAPAAAEPPPASEAPPASEPAPAAAEVFNISTPVAAAAEAQPAARRMSFTEPAPEAAEASPPVAAATSEPAPEAVEAAAVPEPAQEAAEKRVSVSQAAAPVEPAPEVAEAAAPVEPAPEAAEVAPTAEADGDAPS